MFIFSFLLFLFKLFFFIIKSLSGGTRASAHIRDLHYDIGIMIKHIERPDLPVFLAGQSMGGGLVSSFAIRNPELNLSGIILMSSLLGVPNERELSYVQKNAVFILGESLLNVWK